MNQNTMFLRQTGMTSATPWDRRLRRVLIFLACVAGFSTAPLRAMDLGNTDLLTGKLQYEKDLERRVYSLLLSIIGPQKAKVTVSVDVGGEVSVRTEENLHSETNTQTLVLSNGIQEENFDESTTGGKIVAAPTGPANQAGSSSMEESKTSKETVSLPTNVIKKISVTLLISDKVSPGLLDKVKNIVPSALGINSDRGDIFDVKTVSFVSGAMEASEEVQQREDSANFWFNVVKFILSMILGVLFLLFMFNLLSTFKTIKQEEIKVAAQAVAAGPRETTRAQEGPAAAAAALPGAPVLPGLPGLPAGVPMPLPGAAPAGQRFGFLQEKSSRALLHLIEKEPIQTIALVLSYISPEQAAVILESLPGDVQSDVAARIASITQMDADEVNRIEKGIKEKIDYVVGGVESLVNIFQNMDPIFMKMTLDNLALQNAELAQQIKRNLFTFDDLVFLDNYAVQQVARQVPVSEFAIALKNAKEDVQNRVFGALTEGAALLIRQELDLMRPLPPKRYMDAQRRVIQVVRQLELQGIIVVQKPEDAI